MTNDAPHGVILFDGDCVFCTGAALFVARHDPHAYFKLGASRSPRSAALLAQYGQIPETNRSIVLIEDGIAYSRSTAALRIAARLTWPWSMARVLLWTPAPLRDGVYLAVSAVRRRIAGRTNACELPPAEIRARQL